MDPDLHRRRPSGLYHRCYHLLETLLPLLFPHVLPDPPPHPVSGHRGLSLQNASSVVVGAEIVLPQVDLDEATDNH